MIALFARLRTRSHRIAENGRLLASSVASGEQIDKQGPAVREAATWARETRERNHLTDLFFAGRKTS